MYKQLLELRAEAESSRLAASKMSQLLEEIKQDKHEQAKVGREGNSWIMMIIAILALQFILTTFGLSRIAYHNMGRNRFEAKMGRILESIETTQAKGFSKQSCNI